MNVQDTDRQDLFITLLIPVAGAPATLAETIKSLPGRHSRNIQTIFILQDKEDPAAPVISGTIHTEPQCSLIFSGKAGTCSQKNHNLLAGIREAGPRADILLFCDSGHTAPEGWFNTLVQPLLSDDSCMVSSGYHQVYPDRDDICSQGRAVCVLFLSLIRKFPGLAQPWGGATAMRRKTFEELSIAELWATNIVDDVSLARRLQSHKIAVTIPDHSDLVTRLNDTSLRAWISWLTRQWAYLKFIYPGLWLGAGLFAITTFLILAAALLLCCLSPFMAVPRILIQCSLGLLVLFFLFSCFLYHKHPAPGSFVPWFQASIAALTMASWCHCRTWFSQSINWAGICYRVGRGGKVLKITRETGS